MLSSSSSRPLNLRYDEGVADDEDDGITVSPGLVFEWAGYLR